MNRFAYFVDGSNLYGMLKKDLNIKVDNYQEFFKYLHRKTSACWKESICQENASTSIQRIYWYAVGAMSEWDLTETESVDKLRSWFSRRGNRKIRDLYMMQAGKSQSKKTEENQSIEDVAWDLCLSETKEWYLKKKQSLTAMKRFYHAVRTGTDLIDIIECAHWNLSLLKKRTDEKGLDTRLAVDMVSLADNYDVGVVLSGDADMIPSIDLMKRRGKHIGVLELISGHPPETSGRSFASKLKHSADFVERVYETEIVNQTFASQLPSISEATTNVTSSTNDSFGAGII